MKKKLLLMASLLALLACGLPGITVPPSAPLPTQAVESVDTVIALTANSAWTQTAIAQPTNTFTATPTRIPSITPTFTPTFIYLLRTSTPISTATYPPTAGAISGSGGGTGSGGESDSPMTGLDWTCALVGTTPPRNSAFEVNSTFTVYWSLLNTGTKTWTVNGVDLVYTSGYRPDGTRIQDFARNVNSGGKITVSATFTTPKWTGQYQSFFHLMVGKRKFCGWKYPFEVVEK